jgi:PAS domain S-box-containing protein
MAGEEHPTILYVDDDQTNRAAFGWILRSAGYDVKEAATGSEALRLVAQQPDLVILDVNLPDVSGLEVCKRIKSHPATHSIPVLHLSGVFVRSEDKTHALEEGADAYLTKPVEPREVLATVKALLRVREAEVAAAEAAHQWQVTFDALSDAVCLLDMGGNIVRCNQAMADLLGRPVPALVGRPCAPLFLEILGSPGLVPPSSADAPAPPPGEAAWEEILSSVRTSRRRETRELALGQRWFLTTADPVLDQAAVLTGSVHLFAEITEQKRMEEERTRLLAERVRLTDHLRLILESTGEGIFGMDQEGCCTFVNGAAARMFGWSPQEIVGRKMHALAHHSYTDGSPYSEAACPMTHTLRTGQGCRVDTEVLWRRDGTHFPVEYAAHAIRAGDAISGAVVTFFDITERKRLEEQYRSAAKMEAIGRLAGGVAHDFNNLLTVITGNISLILAEVPAGDPRREVLQSVERAAWRAADLVRQLLGFSRQTMLWLQPTNLNVCIDEVVSILRRTIDPRIAIEVHAAPDLWAVRADPGQLSQVLMNLCLNARDAMPEGGRLLLETANVVLDEPAARRLPDARPGEFVRLRVQDTGYGIPAGIQSRIFDPYFTTKEPGKGTGLGLAMVFGIVKQHQGWIVCTSTVNQGACFDIYLHRLSAPTPAAQNANSLPPPSGGSERILLVDDDPMLRALGRTILEEYGYHVLLAEDGLRALEVYRREVGKIDLVILDLTMPQLSGQETLRELCRLDPGVKVVFASGYAAEVSSGADLGRVRGFIQKPYREQDLAAVVRAALDFVKDSGPPAPSA